MADMTDILARVKPIKTQVTICLDGDLVLRRDQIQERLDALAGWKSSSLSDTDPRTALLDDLAQVEQGMRDASQTFTFKSVGDKTSSDLLAAHPSPKDERGNEKYSFDPATYPAALIAAASVDPVMTVEQVETLFDSLNLHQRNQLFNAAFAANNRGVDVPFSQPVSEPAGNTETR